MPSSIEKARGADLDIFALERAERRMTREVAGR
jgi:hypothetical protein